MDKVKASILLAGLLMLFQPLAHAGGPGDGGGGKGVMCGDKLRVLDIFEAEEFDKLPMGPVYLDEWANIANYGPAIARHYSETRLNKDQATLVQEAQWYFRRMQFLPKGRRVPISQDANVRGKLPAGCDLVQIAYLQDEHIVLVDSEYWAKLDAMNRAALILHELLYQSVHFAGDVRFSDNDRFVIGRLFADPAAARAANKDLHPILESLWDTPQDKRVFCGNGGLRGEPVSQIHMLDATVDGQSGLKIVFFQMAREIAVSQVEAFLPGITARQFVDGSEPVRGTAFDRARGFDWKFEIYPHGPGVKVWKSSDPEPETYSGGSCNFLP